MSRNSGTVSEESCAPGARASRAGVAVTVAARDSDALFLGVI